MRKQALGANRIPCRHVRIRLAGQNLLPVSSLHAAHRIGNASGESQALAVAVIDGPYDHFALSDVLARQPIDLRKGSCGAVPDGGCTHGTFIMGMLGARHDALIPGLCPECVLMHVPLFDDDHAPSATICQLAHALELATEAGARLINLSLAILGDTTSDSYELRTALDHAERKGVVIVAAAGNQGQRASGQLLSHSSIIPVAAVDAAQRLLLDSNFGPVISRRGVAALGHEVRGYAPGCELITMSGSSVAAALVTGTIASVWSRWPQEDGVTIRAAVAALAAGDGARPPAFSRNAFLTALERTRAQTTTISSSQHFRSSAFVRLQGEPEMKQKGEMVRPFGHSAKAIQDAPDKVGLASGGCECGASDGVCTCNDPSVRGRFVYAIGTVEIEYPNVAIEREMQIMGRYLVPDFEPNSDQPINLTEDRSWQHAVLSSREGKETRYLARQLSWRLTIEDHLAYILKPRDPRDFDNLIDRLGRPKYKRKEGGKRTKGPKEPSRRPDPTFERLQDSDVVIGVAGAKMAEGTEMLMDQIFPIEEGQLTPPGLGAYFDQLADNYGLSDEDRAYNFLVARYAVPTHDLEDLDKEFELAGVPTMHSRLGGDDRRIVRVIYTFNGKGPNAPIRRQYFVRVDVTDEFPFIVTPWHRYLQRGEET
jgi:subtilase family protein/cyclic patellamide precursor peptide PatG